MMLTNTTVRAARIGLVRNTAVLGRRTMVTKEERWTVETARNAASYIEGPNKIDLSHVIPSIEAKWKNLSKEEQYAVYRQLEQLQRNDWKELTLDQKKAAYFVSFGPHGPRKPITAPGQAYRTAAGVLAVLAATTALWFGIRSQAQPPPRTMTKEWQEDSNRLALEQKQDPITGIASEGYKGKGHVQSA